MAQQEGPSASFDLSKVGVADKIVLGAAAAYFIWVFLPFWYRCCSILGIGVDAGGVSGFRGVLIIAWLLAIVAMAEIVLTKLLGTEIKLPMKRGQVHLVVAAAALVFTVLGLVAKSTGLTLSWGIFVGLILAAIWTYGAYMLSSQPASA